VGKIANQTLSRMALSQQAILPTLRAASAVRGFVRRAKASKVLATAKPDDREALQ
jgi:hypothetical protein